VKRKHVIACIGGIGTFLAVVVLAIAATLTATIPAGATGAVGTGGATYVYSGLAGGNTFAINVPNGQSASVTFTDQYGNTVGQPFQPMVLPGADPVRPTPVRL
jgi:hypothetical protein